MKVTAAIATLALVVGTSSAVGGYYENRSAIKHECATADHTNKAVRALVDDFLVGPDVTKAERIAADKLAAKRFPDLHC